MGDQAMMAYAPPADEPAPAVPLLLEHGHPQRHGRHLLDAGRILLTGGWLILTYTIVISNHNTNAEHALVGLTLLLLGAFLVELAPVAGQFPRAARASAAVAAAVCYYFLAPAD